MTTPLRLDANLKWLFTELPFEERFDAAAAAGFAGVEYSSPYEHSASRLAQLLADAGLEQVLINTPSGPDGSPARSGYACLPREAEQFRTAVDRALEYATALGAGVVHVMGGSVPAGERWDECFATLVTNLAWAADRAAGTGVTLVLEAQNRKDVPGFVFDSIEQAASVVRAVDSERLGLMFDVYHCQVAQGSVVDRLRALLPLVRHVQIADAPTRTEPGTGETNWHTVFGVLSELDYGGWIGCEYRPTVDTLGGLAWRDAYGLAPSRPAGSEAGS